MASYLCEHLGCSKIRTIGFDCADPSSHFYGKNKEGKERLKQLNKEVDVVVSESPGFLHWLSAKNISLEILSDVNPIKAPKINITDIT